MHRTSDKFLSVKNIIQPWLLKSMRKHWEWCCPMLDVESLYHIYKCMGNFCCFTTDNTSAMINHLEKHDDASGILSCSYCAVGTNSITELIDHIQRHHGQCRYQCKFCFYRSLDAANVYNHLQLYHLEEHSSTESILQIPQHPEIPRVHYMTDAVKAKVRHKMLKCTVCHENFLVIASYIQHMQLEHHSNVITCCWCLKTIKKYAIATHLLTHYIGIYECLFCEYACNIKQSMQRHLSNVHSSKPLFCSKRRECKIEQTEKTYLLDMRVKIPRGSVLPFTGCSKKGFDKPQYSSAVAKKDDQAPVENNLNVPKILNVHGGIKLSADGTIIEALETASICNGVSASSVTNELNADRDKKRKIDKIKIPVGKKIKLMPMEITEPYVRNSCNKSPISLDINIDAREGKNSATTSFKPTIVKIVKEESQQNDLSISNALQSISDNGKRIRTPSLHTNSDNDNPSFERIRYHFDAFKEVIDKYYRALSLIVASNPLTCSDINVCGILKCEKAFEDLDALKTHLQKDHKTSITEGKMLITCRHCLLPLQTISAFITHLTVHRLNQYVCFLCCYKHFLLTSVVSHICKDHSCTTVQLSFAHPKKKNLLCDIIVVMPGRLSEAEKRKCIQRTIAMGVNSLDKLSKKPKTCTKPLSASQSASNNVEINQVNLPIDPDAFPKAIHYSTIYKCGFCCKVETSKLSFQKHVIDCSCRNAVYYPCAHCGKSLKFWINRTHRILEHLLFHGENLYYCESCNYFHYSFDNVAMHIRMNHISTCAIKVLRESLEQWECNVCQIRSSMRQKIMEHMQNDHDLPGERFMCSLCNHRVFTNMEGLSHFKSTHPGKKVLMIEMYHLEQDNSSTSESADTDSSNDLDLVDVDREKDTVPLSSCSGQSDGNRSASASVVAQEIDDSNEITNHSKMQSGNEATNPAIISSSSKCSRMCTVWREHSYAKFHSNDEVLFRRNQTQEVDARMSSVAMKFKIKGSSVENAHGLPDISSLKDHEQCSSNSSTVSDGLTNEQITSQLLEDKKTASSVGRRLSKRVAVKKDVSYRWSDCTKFACIFCECSFELFSSLQKHCSIVHKSQSKAFLTDPNVAGNQMESIIAFRLRVLVCCFYCDVRDTYASLRLHHDKKHFPLSFICTDYWNIFKCGLCAYLNGSGNENEFRMHFNHFHSRYSEKTSPYDHVDDAFLEWALTHGKKVNKEDNSKNIIVKYICSQCDEQNENELEMGIHIARHIMTFKCTYCEIHYRNLKVLYEHVITIHRKKDYSVPSSCPLSYDRTLLDVEMCFINGFIISKREAQFTSHGSLQNLEKGFQMYYDSQLDELVKYKETLLMPIFEADEIVSRTSCKTFIQNQSSYPCLKITCLDIDSKSYEK